MPPSSDTDSLVQPDVHNHQALVLGLFRQERVVRQLHQVRPCRPCLLLTNITVAEFRELLKAVETICTKCLDKPRSCIVDLDSCGDQSSAHSSSSRSSMHETAPQHTTTSESVSKFFEQWHSNKQLPVREHDGMEPNENNVNDNVVYDTNDSGFGSCGFSLEPEHGSSSGSGSNGVKIGPQPDPYSDIEKLKRNFQELSDCGFYHDSCSSQMAKDLLRKTPIGTFLIRDSSDSQHLYALSVKTERGATSIRIRYSNGLFQFDSDERIRDRLPKFETVLALADFYVMVTQDGVNKSWRWEETSGEKNMKVNLTKPLKNTMPSLAHMARVRINQCLRNVYIDQERLPIEPKLKHFLQKYPYRI